MAKIFQNEKTGIIEVEWNPWELDALIGKLAALPKKQQQAIQRALRDAGNQVRTYTVRRIAGKSGRYNLPEKYARRFVYKPMVEGDLLKLKINGRKSMPIANYTGAMMKGGYKPHILRGNARKTIPYTFVAPGKNSSKLLVFQRVGETRDKRVSLTGRKRKNVGKTRPAYPIKALSTTSGLEFLLRAEETEGIMSHLQQAYLRRLRYQLEDTLKKLGK